MVIPGFAAMIGVLIGSFLNVVVYRLPRHESLSTPGSHCPGCGTPVRPYDNIPVISWLLLRARCRHCRAPISARYPAVELGTALLALLVAVVCHGAHDIALGIGLVFVLVPVSLIDIDHRIIPNAILAPAAVLAIAIGALTRPAGLPEQLIAGAAAALFLFAFAVAYPQGMGMGDVKLAGVLGLFLGRSAGVAILVAVVGGLLAGGVLVARVGARQARTTKLPFGPFLAAGGLVAVLVGPQLVHWYLTSIV